MCRTALASKAAATIGVRGLVHAQFRCHPCQRATPSRRQPPTRRSWTTSPEASPKLAAPVAADEHGPIPEPRPASVTQACGGVGTATVGATSVRTRYVRRERRTNTDAPPCPAAADGVRRSIGNRTPVTGQMGPPSASPPQAIVCHSAAGAVPGRRFQEAARGRRLSGRPVGPLGGARAIAGLASGEDRARVHFDAVAVRAAGRSPGLDDGM